MQLGILLSLVVTMVFISAAQMIHLASVNDTFRHQKQYVYKDNYKKLVRQGFITSAIGD